MEMYSLRLQENPFVYAYHIIFLHCSGFGHCRKHFMGFLSHVTLILYSYKNHVFMYYMKAITVWKNNIKLREREK